MDEGADVAAFQHADQVLRIVQAEHPDHGHLVFRAQGKGCGVHHLQPFLQGVRIGDVLDQGGGGILGGSLVIRGVPPLLFFPIAYAIFSESFLKSEDV